ncbi:MAG: hypothetical protein AAF078_07555 [Planctomycetota bacterium]
MCVLLACGSWAEDAPRYERIASLSPTLTQMVVELGLGDRLVAVGEHDAVRPDLPVVGTFGRADAERVLLAKPDVVLATGAGGAADPSVIAAARRVGADVWCWAMPMSLGAVSEVVWSAEGEGSLSHRLGVADAGRGLRERYEAALDGLAASGDEGDGVAGRRVLVLLEAEPVSALGPGSPLVELMERTGAVNASPLTTAWGVLDRERLLLARPEVVLLVRPGDGPLVEGDARVGSLMEALPAGARVVVVGHRLGLLPSTSMAEVGAAMVEAIGGEAGLVVGGGGR